MRFVVQNWLESTTVEWVDEGTVWNVVVGWAVIDGHVEPVSLHLDQPNEPKRPVTAAALRRLKVGDVVTRARRQKYVEAGGDLVDDVKAAERGGGDPRLLEEVSSSLVASAEKEAAPFKPRGRGRPPEYGEAHYDRVARIYSEALAAGEPPLQAVEKMQVVSRATASRWVAEARKLGKLRPTTRGKPSRGMSTPDPEEGDR